MTENWRPWPHDERYHVSDQGNVRGPSGNVLSSLPARGGGRGRVRADGTPGRPRDPSKRTPYLMVSIRHLPGHPRFKLGRGNRPASHRRLVHRMVLETWRGECPAGMQASHINGDSLDNRLENLAWTTPQENQRDHRIAQGKTRNVPYAMPDDDGETLRMLASRGLSIAQIADALKVGYVTAWRAMIKHGLRPGRSTPAEPSPDGSGHGPRVLTRAQVDEARKLYESGCKLKALAREFGVSSSALRYWLVKKAA